MGSQSLIIYKFNSLYHILEELSLDLNFKIIYLDSENLLYEKIKSSNNYLIVSNKKNLNLSNHVYLDNKPINISKLVEKINIEFLKLHFNNQSHVKINDYTIDLNSREMSINNKKLKLTEKEINTIIYLIKNNESVSINELQENVWSYQSNIETHTVETHIYRLRKKIFSTFNDNEFIVSKKNGYQIK
jgi:DNA-binding response OmpR family regulator|tara:strand:+ start:342 stop:905 length:564 start_codon:yes stop_codon:yes gene_type:complete